MYVQMPVWACECEFCARKGAFYQLVFCLKVCVQLYAYAGSYDVDVCIIRSNFFSESSFRGFCLPYIFSSVKSGAISWLSYHIAIIKDQTDATLHLAQTERTGLCGERVCSG